MTRDTQNVTKHRNIHIMGVPEKKKKEKGIERIFEEIKAENCPNLMKRINLHIQEAQ